VHASVEAIAAERFDPIPGPHCRFCDFRQFCAAGTAWLAERDAVAT
jgi:CRISPR/Cas system-associated exonuclease Cas4 (RecB family)